MEPIKNDDNEEFRDSLSDFQRKGLLTDVCLLCDGGDIIRAHKLILASCSEYFFEIFTSERESNAIDAVGLQGVKLAAMQALIDIIYKGKLDFGEANIKRLWSVITLANKFKMNSTYRMLRNKFAELIQLNTFFDLWYLVATSEMNDFQIILNNYLVCNNEEVCKLPEFLNMNLEQIYPIFKKCSQDCIPSPILRNCIRSWMNYRRMNKCDILETILLDDKNSSASIYGEFTADNEHETSDENVQTKEHGVTFKEVATSSDIVSKYPGNTSNFKVDYNSKTSSFLQPYALKTSLPSKLDLQQELEWVNNILAKEAEEKDLTQKPNLLKIPDSAVFMELLTPPYLMMIVTESTRNIPYFVHYSIDDNKWSPPMELDITLKQKSTLCYYKGCIYSVGGIDGKQNVLDECFKYNIVTKIIKKLPDLRTPRSETRLEVLDNKLFVLGGKGKCQTALRMVESLDLNEGTSWTIFQAMRNPHEATAASFATRDHIFILGGGTSCCEYYDFNGGTWQKLPSLPDELTHVPIFAAISSGQLVVLRSYTPTKVYYLKNQNWQCINTKGFPPDNILQVAHVVDTIFALTPCSLIFVFNLHNCSWSMLTKVPRLWGNYLCFAIQN